MTRNHIILLAAGIGLAGLAGAARGQAFDMSWFAINGGGQTSVQNGLQLDGTIGQAAVGAEMSGGGLSVSGGFWSIADSPAHSCGSADFNCDGDIGTDADI